ncbi:MAG: hypothetical protein ABI255_05040 [Microbacteriaceae bacterium]
MTSEVPATLTPRRRLRMTRRGRIALTAVICAPLVAGAAVTAVNGGHAFADAANAEANTSSAEFQYVTIRSGQSLWRVAETIAPSADPRDVIADIVNLNQLTSVEVRPGQRVAIPAKY